MPTAEATGTETRNESSSTNVAQVIQLLRRNDGDAVTRYAEVVGNTVIIRGASTEEVVTQ